MPNQPHILHDFDQAIATLRGEVLSMAGKARHNLERGVRALLERNAELANAVIADDDEVDEHERHIDQLGMEILVRFHPMATDLRLVVSSMKVSMNLERISDHATSIAKRARKMSASQELQDTTLIEPLYTLADQLLRDAISSYSDHNAELGASLHARDKELDRMYKNATATFGQRIEQGNGRSQDYLHLILVVRSLERVGDLAVNIGEDAVFVEEALDLRHTAKKSPKPSAGDAPSGE
jgi:phosphate transport system protein